MDRNVAFALVVVVQRMSLPSRGAWIEIPVGPERQAIHGKSLPSRGAWIEMVKVVTTGAGNPGKSLPSRGAWIEMISFCRWGI